MDAPAIFIECKALGAALEDSSGQLARYFNADASIRVAIITDGVKLRVYTDLQQPNMMDPSPWLEIDLLNANAAQVESLRTFRKNDFVPSEISRIAEETAYYNSILKTVAEQLREPSDSFLRWIAGELPNVPRVTVKLVERLTPILRRAIQTAIVDHVARSFSRPMDPAVAGVASSPDGVLLPASGQVDDHAESASLEARPGIVTTAEELEVARIVGEWVNELRADARIAYRDSKTYFTLHQNNVRKWFARFNLDRKRGWVALRHVMPEEGKVLAPGVEVLDGGAFGDARFVIGDVNELPRLRIAILAAFEREASRTGEDVGEAQVA